MILERFPDVQGLSAPEKLLFVSELWNEEFQEGRGVVFMQHLDAALTLMRHHPRSAGWYAEPCGRMLIRDFPFGVFYDEQTTRIVVTAVVELRQDPRAIHRRLFG